MNLEEEKVELTLTDTSAVRSVAIGQDGKVLISGLDNKTIKVWNLEEQREELTLTGHSSRVTSVAITKDGKYIVSASEDTTIKVWNLEEKREEFTLRGHAGAVTSVVISQDGKYLISGSADKTIKIWNLEEKREDIDLLQSLKSEIINEANPLSYLKNNILESFLPDKRKKFCLLSSSSSLDLDEYSDVDISFTECKKFALFYRKKSLVGFLQFFQSNSILKNIYSPQNIWDFYFQNRFEFYNVFDVIKNQNFDNLSPRSSNIVFGQYRYTITHVMCYSGLSKNLSTILNDSFILITDIFGKSPFFYAIKKKQQECVDILLDFISSLFSTSNVETLRFKATLNAMKNDFSLIIQNSSSKLPDFLKSLLVTSNIYFAKVDIKDLPMFHFHAFHNPVLKYFFSEESNNQKSESANDISQETGTENPIRLVSTAFPVNWPIESKGNLEILQSILNCKNEQIFMTPFIQYFIKLQWKTIQNWVIFYSFLISINIILFIALLAFTDTSLSDIPDTSSIIKLSLLIIFFLVNSVLVTWEILQYKSSPLEYFKYPMNWIDCIRIIVTTVWIILEFFTISVLKFSWIVAFLNLFRGITAFRVFDGTRYYITLIIRALNDIKYFIIIFSYSTFSFGVLFLISRSESVNFQSLWSDTYGLNFGMFIDPEDNADYTMDYIVFIGATVINVVLMLNLLISILGDSYERFQISQVIIDFRERTNLIIEILSMTKLEVFENFKYLHVCISANENENWEGRIRYMNNKMDKNFKRLEDELVQDKSSIKDKIFSFENKISLTEKKIETKVSSIEEKIETKISSIEEKIETKMNSINETLEAILKLVQK